METIRVSRAEPIHDPELAPIRLEVSNPVPEIKTTSLERLNEFYKDEAIKVVEVLQRLPQGTLHQVVILLLEKYVTYYKGAPKVWR